MPCSAPARFPRGGRPPAPIAAHAAGRARRRPVSTRARAQATTPTAVRATETRSDRVGTFVSGTFAKAPLRVIRGSPGRKQSRCPADAAWRTLSDPQTTFATYGKEDRLQADRLGQP